ncbi:efflux RND transporter periplasmic adaptor subunit [Micromonospora sp. NPDC051543]|uniref:efflux RND transporter periplasmic adaptor subunit n=1 Tax=Micromonospora sp. NPDC051543 TaxID=3364287 RepID=UPI00378FFFB8
MPARLNLRHPSVVVNAILGVALIGVGFWAYQSLVGPDTTPTANGAVRSVPVQVGTVTKTVTADGTVESASTASASFVTGGTVTAINVKVGQAVKKGQVLAKVDPADAQRGLDAAEADLDAAQDSLDRAQEAGSDASAAENEVAQAQLAVTEAQAAVAGTVLKAPMAGTVVAVNGTLGSSSSGSSSSGSSSAGGSPGGTASQGRGTSSGGGSSASTSSTSTGFIDLADLTKLQVSAAFAEADATRIKEKQAAKITWNALSGTTATGTVSAVDPSATTANNVVTYGVTLTLGKVPAGAKVGQTVSVAVTTGSVQDAVMVSSAAVTTAGNRHTVTVLTDGRQETRAVEIGLEGDAATEITSGVEVGEQVALRAASTTTGTGGAGTGRFPGGGGFGGGPAGGGGFPGGTGGRR